MKKAVFSLLVLSVIFILGCAPIAPPAAPQQESAPAAPAPAPLPVSPEAAPSPAPAETTPAPLENIPRPGKEGADLRHVCSALLSADEFSMLCGHEGEVVLTPQMTGGGCWVNIADHDLPKLTAGSTTTEWKTLEEASKEFSRGVLMRRTQGAVEEKLVGERNYQYKELNRHNVVWQSGAFITRLGSMTDLCPADKLIDLAKKIDSRLR